MSEQIVNYDVDLSKWNVENCLADVVWLLMIDEPTADIVFRNGVFVPTQDINKNAFRIGFVLNAGPDVKVAIKDKYVLIPPTAGIYGHKTHKGHKTWFVKESAIMCTINFDGTKDEKIEALKDLHVGA